MPWKECNIVEERLRFIARLLDGEKMAGLCREFGIAHKTTDYCIRTLGPGIGPAVVGNTVVFSSLTSELFQ